MRILWHSNGMASQSGYGNQTGLFAPLIQAHEDYSLKISAFWGRQGRPAMVGASGVEEYPGVGGDPYGANFTREHVKNLKPDAVVSLIDPFVLDPMIWGAFNWAAWTPVDCDNVGDENLNVIRHAKRVWAMSRFGERELKAAGIQNVDYVPHGVDTDVFTPIDREAARREFGEQIGRELDGKFVVVTVAANVGAPSRKNFQGMMQAFAAFHRAYPESVWYIHTDALGAVGGGENLPRMAKLFGIEDAVVFPHGYKYLMGLYEPLYLNKVYNAADVMLLLSMGEGFGIPIIEAQAAGCPVIVTDGSAMTELCMSGNTVKSVPYAAWGSRAGGLWRLADVDYAVEMLHGYALVDGKLSREKAREFALAYDYRRVFEQYMVPALEKLTPIKLADYEKGGTGAYALGEVSSVYKLPEMDFNPGDVVIDVGANVGAISCWIGVHHPEVRVYAFEPVKPSYDLLVENLEANGCTNVQAFNMAITGDGRDVSVYGALDENAGGASVYLDDGNGEVFHAKSVTLAEFMESQAIERVRLLKLDCEGSEYEILESSWDVLARVDAVRAEFHENDLIREQYDTSGIIAKLQDAVPDVSDIRIEMAPAVSALDKVRSIAPSPPKSPSPTGGEGDLKTTPMVTVLIPTKNGAETICRAVESVLTPPPIPLPVDGEGEQVERVGEAYVEVVVVDDGSTDETVHILRSLRERYAGLVLIEMGENVGQVAAMNAGLSVARGEWVLFIGDDDMVDAGALREMIDQVEDWDDTIGFVYADYQYMGKRADRVVTPAFRREDYHRHFAAGAACMWRRRIGLAYRTLHEGKHAHGEDFDLIYRLVEMGYVGKKLATSKPVVYLNLVDGRGTSWLHANQDSGPLAEFKRRHPQFVGRL